MIQDKEMFGAHGARTLLNMEKDSNRLTEKGRYKTKNAAGLTKLGRCKTNNCDAPTKLA